MFADPPEGHSLRALSKTHHCSLALTSHFHQQFWVMIPLPQVQGHHPG